ncbi:MAG: hypothetical protein EF807_01295 [Candidatus Methanolliviera hydrocarbonicum]|uniref:Uncharacterized protein n=1 Tax=Candidatus Methanolliviera hydrocarbonicum TaxID=2491085 RepID=A0A520KYJ5_9EURY|nr:MAG: hypothetical protein EF807_01295 [Candidatus Methanolliviera hydrocarbonicum]
MIEPKKGDKMKRGAMTILGIIAFVLMALVAVNLLNQEGTIKEEIPEYKIDGKTDISVPHATRLSYSIVVKPGISEKEVKLVAEDVVNKAKKYMKFNGLVIFMHDREEDIDKSYTIAKVGYLPYGEWSKDTEIRAGDYSKHKFVYDIKKKVTDPNIERPTEREFEIYDRCSSLLYEYHMTLPDVSTLSKGETVELAREIVKREEGIAKQVAEEYDITVEEVLKIYRDVVLWQLY